MHLLPISILLAAPSFLHSLIFFTLFSLQFVHPLSFNITNFDDPSVNMAYEGDGKSNNGSIELNAVDFNCRVGRAIYGQPLQLWDSSTNVLTDFSTSFSFTIDTVNDTIGDGFVFYMAPLGYQIPPNAVGGTFALFNDSTNRNNQPQNHVVAVEFDTFVGSIDPPMQHVGIDDNSLISLATAKFDIAKNLGVPCHALITYDGSTKTLQVSWSFNGSRPAAGSNLNSSSNSLSLHIDLMQALPELVNVGFSASTGFSNEKNVIHSWQFHSTLSSSTMVNHGEKKKLNIVVVVVVPVIVAVILLLVVVSVGWLIIKKRRTSDNNSENSVSSLVEFDLDKATIPRRFDYKELVTATNGFADDKRLGQGGSGQVYKGVLSYLGRVVAVKRIFADIENSERVFNNEMRIISRLIHRNLVQFIGWCHEQGEFLLVFEYMPNGSLDTHLFGSRKTLPWNLRYKIAQGVATALHYLHEDAEQCVLHRDIKSANVLLDTDFSTKLGDFGMAKLVDPRLRTQRTGVVGTYGYLAPEYINGGRASKESDMYSFGVVALEIASGRRTYRDGEFHVPLTNWIWQLYAEGKLMEAADERLNKEFDVNEMMSLLSVGLWCTLSETKERPKAAQVIKVLQLEAPLPVLPKNVHVPPIHSTIVQGGH